MDKAALGQVSSKYFDFPYQFLFHKILHTHLSPEAGTIGQLVADVPGGLSLTPPHETSTAANDIYNSLSIISFVHVFCLTL
jgi:hypothetical protein